MEIERKWLVDPAHIPYDLGKLQHNSLEQAYLCFRPAIRIRSINGSRFVLTVKAEVQGEAADPLAREEFETPLGAEQYALLRGKAEGTVITKTRYLIPYGSLTGELDLFHGALEGLAYLEIEFPSLAEAKAYPTPDWVVRDVSGEGRYLNSALAQLGMPPL